MMIVMVMAVMMLIMIMIIMIVMVGVMMMMMADRDGGGGGGGDYGDGAAADDDNDDSGQIQETQRNKVLQYPLGTTPSWLSTRLLRLKSLIFSQLAQESDSEVESGGRQLLVNRKNKVRWNLTLKMKPCSRCQHRLISWFTVEYTLVSSFEN